MVKKSDEKLVRAYLTGEETAFEILLDRYLKPIYNFVYRLVWNKETAEDIVQETFFKVWQNLKKFDQKRKLKPWLYAIARNTTIDHLRKKSFLPFAIFSKNNEDDNFLENIADDKIDFEENFDRKINKEKLEKGLRKLDLIYKEVLLLYYQNEFSLIEISLILKLPYNTVKSRFRRGVVILKKTCAQI